MDELNNSNINIEKKRRGRKPKNPTDTTIIHRRGRKSLTKLINVIDNTVLNIDDVIIAHIPISTTNINKLKNNIITTKSNDNIEPINNIINLNDDNMSNTKNCSDCIEYEKKIAQLTTEIVQLRNGIISNTKNVYNKLYKSTANFVDLNGNDWSDHTNIACWWCCHKFNTIPLGIPEYIDKGKFYLVGCFCSFNCMLAYNLDMNDYKIWDRQSRILQFKNIINENKCPIKPAPARQVLSLFGGPLSIDEFRNSFSIINKDYRCLLPPMASIIMSIEEDNKQIGNNIPKHIKKSKQENNLI